MQCEVWSVKCEVWSVKSAVISVKCEVELQMRHVKQDTTSQNARTHRLGWRTAHARSIDENVCCFIYIYIYPKATSAPPRAGTTGKITVCGGQFTDVYSTIFF